MESGKWITLAASLTFFACAAGAWINGQQGAAFLLLGLVIPLLILDGYGRYRRAAAPGAGPADPSREWKTAGGSCAGEVGVFRYSQGALNLMKVLVALSALFAPVIYLASSPRPTGTGLIGLSALGVCFFLCFYLGYLACKAYSVEVQAEAVVVHGLIKSRTYSFSSMGAISLLEGGGRGPRYVLALYDKANKQLRLIGDGVANFEGLVALMKKRSFEEGISYRFRDRWGCWSK